MQKAILNFFGIAFCFNQTNFKSRILDFNELLTFYLGCKFPE